MIFKVASNLTHSLIITETKVNSTPGARQVCHLHKEIPTDTSLLLGRVIQLRSQHDACSCEAPLALVLGQMPTCVTLGRCIPV